MSDKDNELNERPDETVTEAETTEAETTEAVETSDAAIASTTEAGTDATTDVDAASIDFDVIYDDDEDETDAATDTESSETVDVPSAAEQNDETADADIVKDNANRVNETLALQVRRHRITGCACNRGT